MTEEEKPYTFEENAFIGTGTFSGAVVGYSILGLVLASFGLTATGPIAGTAFASA